MPTSSVPYARNTIQRALRAILDPEPTRKDMDRLWKYFDSSCAYCGRALVRSERNGHADHLVPTSMGGTNHISNHVLACDKCNGDEKRDQEWHEFLALKVRDRAKYRVMSDRIKLWVTTNQPATARGIDAKLLAHEVGRALLAFDGAVRNLRKVRAKDSAG